MDAAAKEYLQTHANKVYDEIVYLYPNADAALGSLGDSENESLCQAYYALMNAHNKLANLLEYGR